LSEDTRKNVRVNTHVGGRTHDTTQTQTRTQTQTETQNRRGHKHWYIGTDAEGTDAETEANRYIQAHTN
jgi:hypothetical protein